MLSVQVLATSQSCVSCIMHLSVIDTVCILPFRALKIMPILPVLKGCKPLQHFPPTANELKSADFEVQEEKKGKFLYVFCALYCCVTEKRKVFSNAWKTLTPTLVVSRANSSFHFEEIRDSRFFQGLKKRKFCLQLHFGL